MEENQIDTTAADEPQNSKPDIIEKDSSPLKTKPPFISTKVLIILVAIAVVLVGALGVLAYNNYRDSKQIQVVASVTPSAVPSLEVKTATSDRVIDEGVTWLAPEKIEDQGLFEKTGSQSDYASTDYYKVGQTSSGGEIILALVNLNALIVPGQVPIHRIIKNQDSYKRIAQNSVEISGDQYGLTKKITNDTSFVFKSLSPDKIISKDETDLISVQNPRFAIERDPQITQKKIASTKWGDLFIEFSKSYSLNDINKDNSDKTEILKIARYFVKLNDSTEMSYEVRPKFFRDDNTFDLDYSISKVDGQKYDKFETGGCGFGLGSLPYLVDTDSLKNNLLVGSRNGTSVYTITNTDNKTLQYAYELYKSDQNPSKVSIDEFAKNYGFLYTIDAYGSTIGYLKSEYKPAMECGKPVVYLYPNQKTEFKVSVGAKVTKSDPPYDKLWQGTAFPDGKLVVNGKNYPNLFWEGKGYGEYPKVDFGKVIKTADAKSVLTTDLKAMNLNDQEVSDFLAFWLDKMPKTQYTRISWLTNKELDLLAPLKVSPKPESVIRVFLDFSGLNTNASIKNQTLPTFERNGFTVVEWGGLLK